MGVPDFPGQLLLLLLQLPDGFALAVDLLFQFVDVCKRRFFLVDFFVELPLRGCLSLSDLAFWEDLAFWGDSAFWLDLAFWEDLAFREDCFEPDWPIAGSHRAAPSVRMRNIQASKRVRGIIASELVLRLWECRAPAEHRRHQ
jgi:hypothetical protein